MKHLELGVRDGPLTLFGGPYSNLRALRALRDRLRGTPICTGDVVAYGAEPAETLAQIREMGAVVVAGNCERQIAAGAEDCGCGFEGGSACDLLSRGWFPFARDRIDVPGRAWMAGLPDIASFVHRGARYAVLHGGFTDISRFLWPDSSEAEFAEEIAAVAAAIGPVDGIVAGHCGLAFAREIGRVRWINAGAIGLPPNDGDPATRFVVLEAGEPRVERLDYDHAGAAASMRAAGLTQGYDDALLTGWWPSEDVLPAGLRRAAFASG